MRAKFDREVMEGRDHLEMLKRPDLWGYWPVLPMKKPAILERNFMDVNGMGYVLDAEGCQNKVFIGNIFLASKSDRFIQYDSLEAMLIDGWVVD